MNKLDFDKLVAIVGKSIAVLMFFSFLGYMMYTLSIEQIHNHRVELCQVEFDNRYDSLAIHECVTRLGQEELFYEFVPVLREKYKLKDKE